MHHGKTAVPGPRNDGIKVGGMVFVPTSFNINLSSRDFPINTPAEKANTINSSLRCA